MWEFVKTVLRSAVSAAKGRRTLALENLALRHQIEVLQRQARRPKLRNRDRLLWIALRRIWPGWKSSLYLVQPATVVKWHRAGFRRYWRIKSRPKGGRPRIDPEIRKLIRNMWSANRVLYVLIIMSHDRRRVIHFNVTDSPTSEWTARQLLEAFPFPTAPRHLLHDNDSIFQGAFSKRAGSMGIDVVRTAVRSPRQNAYCERLIGSIRRECLDHIAVLNEQHLRRVLQSYVDYYYSSRTHQGLENDCPVPREVELPEKGEIVALPQVGGLHHRYSRRMAA